MQPMLSLLLLHSFLILGNGEGFKSKSYVLDETKQQQSASRLLFNGNNDQPIKRPDLFPSYIADREKCVWKPATESRYCSCDVDILECEIPRNTTAAEGGTASLQITRYGPFTTTGGYQQSYCFANTFLNPPGYFITQGLVGPVDPYTGQFLEFPPLHIHHISTQAEPIPALSTLLPQQSQQQSLELPQLLQESLPFLSALQISTSFASLPSGGADYQCSERSGGAGCFLRNFPTGFGKRLYAKSRKLVMHVQDVRPPRSPPMSHYIEYAQTVVPGPSPPEAEAIAAAAGVGSSQQLKQQQKQPLLNAQDFTMHVGTKKPPFDWKLPLRTAAYTFVTYYFPLRSQLVAARSHMHALQGDELWVLRGSQSDLGIPAALQRPVVTRVNDVAMYHGPVLLQQNGSLAELMQQFEKNLQRATADFQSGIRRRIQSDDNCPPLNRKQRPMKTAAVADSDNNTSSSDWWLPFDSDHCASAARLQRPPELLCKHFGDPDFLTADDIAAKAAEVRRRFESHVLHSTTIAATGGGSQVRALFNSSDHRARIYPLKNMFVPTGDSARFELVTAQQQMFAIYAQAQPGLYYRSEGNSYLQRKQQLHQQQKQQPSTAQLCNSFELLKGEYLTIIHFVQPRIPSSDSTATTDTASHETNGRHSAPFDITPLVLAQHSRLYGQVHFPDLPL